MAQTGLRIEPDLQLVRFATRRFAEIQGLRPALAGTSVMLPFVLVAAVYGLGPAPWPFQAMMAFLGGFFALLIPGMLWLDRYYEGTFGRVVRSSWQGASLGIPVLLAGVMLVEQLADLPRLSLLFSLAAAWWAWLAVRDWPWRGHWLCATAGAGLALLTVTAAVPPPGPPVEAWGLVAAGAALAVSGIQDHRLLCRALPGLKAHRVRDDDETS